ncbi:hypothetical protein EDB83DRAFT_2321509 [Lactarius deliciosus]|nr:hypothetical protein EDB83DRAFT_2321509 [Lactarius deliciosus]
MQPRISSLAVLTSLILLAASDLVVAQISAPNCTLSFASVCGFYDGLTADTQSFNTLGQNMCTIAAYLMSTCNGGVFTIDALQPGSSYTGPSNDTDDVNPCKCNTVTYNLISACDACQGSTWKTWSEYSFNCTSTLPPSTFPNAVPQGTRVPQWALVDNTLSPLFCSSRTSGMPPRPTQPGVTPELAPGSLISASTSGSVSPTSSTSSSAGASSSPSSSGSGSNTAVIAGSVAGGVVALAAIGALLFYFMRKRQAQAPSAAVDGATPPMSKEDQLLSEDETHVAPMKLYVRLFSPTRMIQARSLNTRGCPTSTQEVYGPVAQNGDTLAKAQPAHPQGYHGLPTV